MDITLEVSMTLLFTKCFISINFTCFFYITYIAACSSKQTSAAATRTSAAATTSAAAPTAASMCNLYCGFRGALIFVG